MSYEYESDNRERQALSDVIARWRSSAAAKGVRSFVLFVPSSRGGLGLSASYVKELNAGAGETFAFEFEDPEIDWKRYNLTPKGECHPSAYGNERIALYIAKQILTP